MWNAPARYDCRIRIMGKHSDVAGNACSVLATVVIYKRSIENSEAIQALLRCLAEDPALAVGFRVLLYDNSSEAQRPPEFSAVDVCYHHDRLNSGLAVAYNHALGLAVEAGIPWLMLLDQDTRVTAEYLHEVLALQPVAAEDPRIVAFAPKLAGLTGLRSPAMDFLDSLHRQVILPRWRRPLIASQDTYGLQQQRTVAFNSGAVLRTRAVQDIGGFPTAYWLDFLDMAVFHDLYRQGGHLFVMHSTLEHSLSVEEDDFLERTTSLSRHRNILSAMTHYVKMNGTAWERLLHRGWLTRNFFSLISRPGGRRFATASLSQAFTYRTRPRASADVPSTPVARVAASHGER
jgi:GT2 family glycosyltransferase